MWGPNLRGGGASIHVHREDCADTARRGIYRHAEPPWGAEFASVRDITIGVYPPSDFNYDEATEWPDFAGDIRIFPCASDLPWDAPDSVAPDGTALSSADTRPDTSPDADLHARWVPSHDQLALAETLFADPTVGSVIVPIALPGKQPGWWTVGQPVEHVAGLWPIRSEEEYRAARDGASMAATSHLGVRPGLPSYAVIRRDGHAAMFEDIDWRIS